MKTLFALILSALSLSTSIKAQSVDMEDVFPRVEFGFRFMPTVSNFSMQTYSGGTIKGEATFGYGVGGMMGLNFSKHAGLQAEILYNSLSQKYEDEGLEHMINVRYINIPLMFSLNTGKQNAVNLNFVFGPQLGMSLGSSFETSGGDGMDTLTYVLATKATDFGFAYGAGFEFTLNEHKTIRMDLGFRGVHGIENISDNSKPAGDGSVYIIDTAKVRTKALYVGLTFMF